MLRSFVLKRKALSKKLHESDYLRDNQQSAHGTDTGTGPTFEFALELRD